MPKLFHLSGIAQILTGERGARACDAVAWIHDLCDALRLPGLRQYDLSDSLLPVVVEKAKRASSMKGNPIELRDEELLNILGQAID